MSVRARLESAETENLWTENPHPNIARKARSGLLTCRVLRTNVGLYMCHVYIYTRIYGTESNKNCDQCKIKIWRPLQ